MRSICFLLLFCFSLNYAVAQKPLPAISVLTEGTPTSIRGLSVVNDMVVWASGSHGTVGRSTNGGKDWKWITVKGFEKSDFRDIEAFDGTSAIIMAVSEPAYILKTIDGGDTWKVVYENKTKGIFLDAMEFWNEISGIVVGDPIGGKFFVARTFDGGSTWQEIPDQYRPAADSGEACFAASGTNIRALDRDEAVFVSGGARSRVFIRNDAQPLPVIQGKESTGANSIAVLDKRKLKGGTTLMVVGGDFANDTSSTRNCFYSTDRGQTWHAPSQPPHGYRSCVEYLSKKQLITCGTSGVDVSYDGGKTWKLVTKEGYHVCRIAKNGTAVYVAGSNGRIGKVIYTNKKR